MPQARLAERPGFFTFYGGNTGVVRYRNNSQHRMLTLGEEHFHTAPAGLESTTF